MRKVIFASLLAGVMALGLTACSDDRDSNPTVQQPESFVLNMPALAGNIYDLENSDSLTFTYTQPAYGYTAAVSYYTQVSLTDEWQNFKVEANGDTTVYTSPKYVELDGFTTKALTNASAADIDKAIMKMGGYGSAEEVPASDTLYVRMRAKLDAGYECTSNAVRIIVKPYYKALVQAAPELWYMIGGCIGDGTWGSTIGTSVYPMCPIEGETYDETTGQGPLTFTGYFVTDQGFKIVKVPGEWGVGAQWGCKDGDFYTPYLKDDAAEGGNFTAPEDGYYTINLNTKTNTLSLAKAASDPTEYASMYIIGDFDSWAFSDQMSPVDTWTGAKPHVWTFSLSLTADTNLKFAANGAWDANWGGSGFPYGWGSQNGANIPVAAGNYTVIFNDITGYYNFYSK